MLLCLVVVVVVVGFRDTATIGNAYGLAVITVMFVTTLLMFLIISTVWKRDVFLAFLFVAIFGFVELSYFGACLAKAHKGGWFPLVVSAVVVSLMSAWHYGESKRHAFELENKVSLDSLLSLGTARVPEICLVCSHVTSVVPPMFAHFVTNFPAFHQILIFVTVHSLMIPKVPVIDRFHVSRIGSPDVPLFWCIVRYGYKDIGDNYKFETQLIEKITEFLKCELNSKEMVILEQSLPGAKTQRRKEPRLQCLQEASEDVNELMKAKEAGVTYMMGHTWVIAREASCILKKLVINYVYGFLRRNSRCPATSLGIPHSALIEVGMVYRV
ncbi:potassium transporter 13 [Populus alba x Populus x berolinensis]|nr:potassium transporter 13 [Populus alba x Populus x berolinensis]